MKKENKGCKMKVTEQLIKSLKKSVSIKGDKWNDCFSNIHLNFYNTSVKVTSTDGKICYTEFIKTNQDITEKISLRKEDIRSLLKVFKNHIGLQLTMYSGSIIFSNGNVSLAIRKVEYDQNYMEHIFDDIYKTHVKTDLVLKSYDIKESIKNKKVFIIPKGEHDYETKIDVKYINIVLKCIDTEHIDVTLTGKNEHIFMFNGDIRFVIMPLVN